MEIKSWIEGINGLASLYSFDILPDGSFSEIRLMAVNQQNVGMLMINPNAPEFYPGIPYRNYWMDLNFESFVYKCGSTGQPLYSYVNARGVWLKGFYLPIAEMGDQSYTGTAPEGSKTVYCLYVISYSDTVDSDSMSQKSPEVANAVMEISIRLHESRDFYQTMAAVAAGIQEFCGAEKCSIYTVDKTTGKCSFINRDGLNEEYLEQFAAEMNRSPFEVAEAWEKDLALSDCLLLEDLSVVEERDPAWYRSLTGHGIRNIILYAIRSNQTMVGYIWAANYDVNKLILIKETLEIVSFQIAAVIYNHQLLSRLEEKSTVDGLTKVGNRNAMNDRLNRLTSGEDPYPGNMGVVFADLNGLKAVNDREGHDAGDTLLERAAALLKIAFGEYEIFRAGGDEFVILCPDILQEELNQRVAQLRGLSENTSDVSFAVGISYSTGEYDITAEIQTADEDMYRDKRLYYKNHPEKDRRKRETTDGADD